MCKYLLLLQPEKSRQEIKIRNPNEPKGVVLIFTHRMRLDILVGFFLISQLWYWKAEKFLSNHKTHSAKRERLGFFVLQYGDV